MKLTLKDNETVHSLSPPMPIQLEENIIVDLALMQKYKSITILPFAKYAGRIFAQKKFNHKLRLLVDLRKINSLNADDYN